MNVFALVAAAMLPMQQVVTDSIDLRLDGADTAKCMSRFLDYPNGSVGNRAKLNPSFWAKGIDLSCASPWNSDRGRCKAGTLISKRHIVFAKHFPIAPGSRIVFVGADGEKCPCRVEKTKQVLDSDIMIGALDYEVTPSIRPAKILPVDYEKYIGDGRGLPMLTLDQHERAFVTEIDTIPTNRIMTFTTMKRSVDLPRLFRARKNENLGHARFAQKLIGGDSGNPSFLIVREEPVLLYCLSGGEAGAGPPLHLFRYDIQQVMDELCPGYKLEAFDFSKVAEAKQ